MMEHELRTSCAERFQRIEDRLDRGEDTTHEQGEKIHQHDVEMTELRANINHLVKSMDGQTKAIWGMVVTLLTMGLGFVIWYIQSIPR
jgi:hypothetical protein